MVGILLVTHNDLGESLIACVEHVLGRRPSNLKALPVYANDPPTAKEKEGRALVEALDDGSGVLVLVDVFGATPCNIARRFCRPGRVEGVAGVNLPMLLKMVCAQNQSLADLVARAQTGGRDCIVPLATDSESENAATRCNHH